MTFAAAGVLFVGTLWLYLGFPDRMYLAGFDGLIFGAIADGTEPDWQKYVFHANHLLFNALGMVAYRFLRFFGSGADGYGALEMMNAVLGATGVTVFFLGLRALTRDGFASALGALALGGTFGYWRRASEGQVYMPSLLCLIGLSLALAFYLKAPARRGAAVAAGMAGLATLFHQSNVLSLLALPVAIRAATPDSGERRRHLWWGGLTAVAVIGIPYLAALFLEGKPNSLHDAWQWMLGTSGRSYRSEGGYSSPFAGIHLENFTRISVAMVQAVWFGTTVTWGKALSGLAVGGAYGWAVLRVRPWRTERSLAMVTLALAAPYAVFFTFWAPGEIHFWVPQLIWGSAFLTVCLALIPRESLDGRVARAALAVGVLTLWLTNFTNAIHPHALPENNESYQRAMFLRHHTRKGGTVVISGTGWLQGKVYIPAFSHIARVSLDLSLIDYPKPKAFADIHRQIDWGLHKDIPVYLLSEVLEWPETRSQLRKLWGVTDRELEELFQPYTWSLVAKLDEKFRLYRLALKGGSAHSWAAKADKAIAAKRWAAAAPMLEKAVALDPTAATLQNLGNCYYLMGQKEKAIAVWQKAVELNPANEGLRRNLATLQAGGSLR